MQTGRIETSRVGENAGFSATMILLAVTATQSQGWSFNGWTNKESDANRRPFLHHGYLAGGTAADHSQAHYQCHFSERLRADRSAVSYTHLDVYKRQQQAIQRAVKDSSAQPPKMDTGVGNRGIPAGNAILDDVDKWSAATQEERMKHLA